MSTGEQVTGDRSGELSKRTFELAMGAGKAAADRAATFLGRHSDVIEADVGKRIEASEFDRAFNRTKADRKTGHRNDNSSIAPGVTIYMSKAGFEEAMESAEKLDEGSYFAEYMQTAQPVDDEGVLYTMRLPEGAYSMGWGGCTFYGEATFEDDMPAVREKPFSSPYDAIVRIEGDSGELWQNYNFQPDGSPAHP